MSAQVSLTTCLARMYEGSNPDSQNKSESIVQVKKPSSANQSSVANNLSTMDGKLNLLNEKVDQIANFQRQVLRKLEDMSQEMCDLEKNIVILKTLKGTNEVVGEKKGNINFLQHADCLSQSEVKPLFMELLKLVTSVQEGTTKQKEKLEGIEKMVSAVDKAIHFVGETFKNSHIIQFILKGTVPWKKGNLTEFSEAKTKVEEKDAKAKCGFSNRGIQVQISREVFEGSNECEDSQKLKDAESIVLTEGQARLHCKEGTPPHQPSETTAKHKDLGCVDPQGAPVTTNNSGVAGKKKACLASRGVKESKECTQSQKSTEDHRKEMTKTSTKNEEYQVQRTEGSEGKEKDKTKAAITTEAPEIILETDQSKFVESSTLLPERTSGSIKGRPSKPTEAVNLGIKVTKENEPINFKVPKESLEKLDEQQKPTDITKPDLWQKSAKGTKPITAAADVRVSKPSKQSENQEKASQGIKTQSGQKSEGNIQGCQNKTENYCDPQKGSESKGSEESQTASKEPDKVNDLAKGETDSTDTTSKAEKTKEDVEKSEDFKTIIDDSPSPPAPFSHRIVTTRQIQVASIYTVHQEEVLGGGRFGQVHKCAETSTGLELAAKIIKVKGAKEREEVKNEISVMNQLSHVNLIQLYDAFEAKNNVTLIMEYVGGGELFDRIIDENYKLTELDTIIFVKQICEGIQYIHQQYVLHLDLKPENILCVNTTGNQIKIIDFGLARRYKPREKLKVNFGTPEFLAPEVVNYDYVSFSTDMWSVGVITYMLLSGLSPFLGEHDTETMNNIINSDWEFDEEGFENVSEEAKEFVSNLLVKEKCGRFSASQCLKHKWLNNLTEKANKYRVRLRSQVMLQKYMLQRLWKKNYYAVAAANRFKKITQQNLCKNT
ncbi:myosin light chain kinase 3 isoform X1 [Mobula hypostoma]|uniref:myosin light chain kinase 3 isoform X1 n=1 Tax=Mobula hypostoma TaxID=723540 RepID=UPI002FC285D4